MTKERFYDLKELESVCKLKRSSIYRMMKEKAFPRPIQLGQRRVMWLSTDIEKWMNHRIEKTHATNEEVKDGIRKVPGCKYLSDPEILEFFFCKIVEIEKRITELENKESK